jgi:hypothetical protein
MKDSKNKKASPVDIVAIYLSILHLGFSGVIKKLPAVRSTFSAPQRWKRLLNIIGRFFILIVRDPFLKKKFSKNRNYETLRGKPWLFIISENNRNTLSSLKEKIKGAVYVTDVSECKKKDDIVLLLDLRIWLYLYKFPYILWHCYKVYNKEALSYIDYVFKAVGHYEACLWFLKKYRPAYIVFSNDHVILPKALLLAAKSLKIPTVYIQHASVSSYFPPLDFDLNLLEGQATVDIYKAIGPIKGKTHLIGMPKFDSYINCRNQAEKVTRMGVCYGLLDEQGDIERLLFYLKEELPEITFSFRPHPIDNRDFILPEGVCLSTKEETIFEFLQKQDLIIAGNTSTHLEAVLLNVTSIYYAYSAIQNLMDDYYGYYKNNLVKKANSKEELVALIQEQAQKKDKDIYQKAVYYNALVGTENEGKSSALAIQYIDELISN